MTNALLISMLGLILIIHSGCAQKPQAEKSCGFSQNSSGQRLSWNSQIPIKLYFDQSFPKEYLEATQSAAAAWENSVGFTIFEFAGVIPSSEPAEDGRNVIYWEKSWTGEKKDQQASTSIHATGVQITEADVRINGEHFSYSANPSEGQIDVESIMLHELGHVLGLEHSVHETSVMKDSLAQSTLRREISKTDTENIRCEY